MTDKPMTEEEYLRASGWIEASTIDYPEGTWRHPNRAPMVTARALEVQLAEDRARAAFVRSRDAAGADKRIAVARATATPHPGAQMDEPPESEPVDDLDAVARRIDKRLNDLYFHETGKATAIGVWKPGVYAQDGSVVVIYNLRDDVTFCLSGRAARAYEKWLAAGNVGRHYAGEAIREEILPKET